MEPQNLPIPHLSGESSLYPTIHSSGQDQTDVAAAAKGSSENSTHSTVIKEQVC